MLRLHQQRWLSLPDDVRSHVKRNVTASLGTESQRPSVAAQCVASIAVAEVPHNLWPDVISILTQNVTNPSSTELMKEAALEAIGYICQDIEPDLLTNKSNEMLTAIVHGMRKEEASNYVKFAATTALFNSLEFTKANFEKDSERHFIMEVVCEATVSPDLRVSRSRFPCVTSLKLFFLSFSDPPGDAG